MTTGNSSGKSRNQSFISLVDVENHNRFYLDELQYSRWWSWERVKGCFQGLPEDSRWVALICALVLVGILLQVTEVQGRVVTVLDLLYNVLYGVHVLATVNSVIRNLEATNAGVCTIFGFFVDAITFLHYCLITPDEDTREGFKNLAYLLRLHRPLRYLCHLNDHTMKASIAGTTLVLWYVFLLLRIIWTLVWTVITELEEYSVKPTARRALSQLQHRPQPATESTDALLYFLAFVFIVNKMFIPIGPSIVPGNNLERIFCLLIMISGSLVVTGAAVATLSLVISIYMRPEEAFRERYRLIMKEMKESHIPLSLREKVETFYKMYWQKQKAVSTTRMLSCFPPSLPNIIYTDIFFKAFQKSRIVRNLPYQFLSELAKDMHTIHYIPGDTIIKRTTKKSSLIYITYGDIEMLTAEDDSTAILRMTRGSVLSSCAPCPAAGCARAHVEIRAATFCTAHVLQFVDLWKTVVKHSKDTSQGAAILAAFEEHFDKVKRHYFLKNVDQVKFKSSILHFKRNLLSLLQSKDDRGNSLISDTDVLLEISGCYIMRNRMQSSATGEVDAICLKSTFPCILQPASSLQIVWNLFVSGLIIVVCITHPYYLVYKKEVSLEFRFYDYVVTAIFALDLMVYISTGTIVEDGIPITLAYTSSQQASSRWFVLDVLGTLPVFEFIGQGHFAGINKVLRLPKVFRVLKRIEQAYVYHSHVLRFISFSLMILVSCYFIAALQQGFMCFQLEHCLVTNFTHPPFWAHLPSDDKTVRDRLLFSLYWSISMVTFTTHMETWGTENWNNTLYTMTVLEICIVLHIFIEAVYSATIMVTTALRENFDANIETVNNLLVRTDVDPQLRHRFITYLQLCWFNDKAYSTSSRNSTIFHDLPPHVYQDIVTRQRSKFILCIPIMKLLHRDDLRNVSSKARMFYTSPNEILMNTGDIINEMYVIKQGICEVLSPETKGAVGELVERNHFGMLECLLRLPAFYTVRAVTHVQVFCISRKYLTNALKIPKISDAIEFAKAQPEYGRLQQRCPRFMSYEPESPAPNRELFRLPRKHEQDSAFLKPFVNLGFLSVLRYIFPRFTLRPDGRYLVQCEWARAACALLSAAVFPSYTYLVLQWPWLRYVAALLDCAAYFDLFQRMLVGYFNEAGILVYHPSSTAAHYLRGAFLVDLFACLPFESLESQLPTSNNIYRLTVTKQVLMLNRLVQLYRTPGALLGFAKYVRRDILLVINAMPLFIALINVLTCFMVLYSVNIFYTLDYSYLRIIPRKDKGGSWIMLFNHTFRYGLTETPWNLHLTCLFWVIFETTTTGYNCIKPSNLHLMQVLLVGMIIGALITTYFSVRIISVRANVNKQLAAFQQNMKDMATFMRRECLKIDLQSEVLDYYTNDWEKMGGNDFRNVLKLCDQVTLRSDAILNIFGPTFVKCPILTECDTSLLRIMGRAVRSYHFLKTTVIIDKDDVIGDIYIVDQGSVEIPETTDDFEHVVVLGKGSIFGNLEGPSTIRYPVCVTASTKVHLLQLSAEVFHNIIKDFPSVIHLMEKYRPNNESYIEGVLPTIASQIKERSFITPIILRYRELLKFIHFRSSFVQIYLIMISLSCIYIDVYNAGFLDNRFGLIIALYVHDLAFYGKFLIQYFLPYVSEDSQDTVIELLKIRKTYFKKEFKIDILSCLPIELFAFVSDGNQWLLFAWLRLNRVLRIVTVYECLKRYHKHFFVNLTITTLFSVFIWFSFFIHIITCLWYFIGIIEEERMHKSSWFYNDHGVCWCSNTTTKYICSLYFILTTFTQNGVGDILPKKQTEVMFVSILQVVSTMAYMIYVGEFSNLIQYQSFRAFSYYSKYLELQEFLKNNRVSKNLVKIVNKYTLHLWRESRGVQVPYFLETAPNNLKLKVMSAAYLHHLKGHRVFKCCEPAFLRQLVGHLKLYFYNEEMYIVKQSEITNSMYIIHSGRVVETTENVTRRKVYQTGQCFGVVQGLTYDFPHTHSYQSTCRSQILTLCFEDWEYLLNHFPKSKECIYKYYSFDGGFNNENDKRNIARNVRISTANSKILINETLDGNKLSNHETDISPSKADDKMLQENADITSRSPSNSIELKIDNMSQHSDPVEDKTDSWNVDFKHEALRQFSDIPTLSQLKLDDEMEMSQVYNLEDRHSITEAIVEENITANDFIELNKNGSRLNEIKGDEDSLALVLYSKKESETDEEPASTSERIELPETLEGTNSEQQSLNEDDKDNVISQILDPMSSNEINIKNSKTNQSNTSKLP